MSHRKIVALVFALIATPVLSEELATVPFVDLTRYLGTWHEIARFENKHQVGCVDSTATYVQDKELIQVTNRCTLVDGSNKHVTGRAKVANAVSNAELKVNFAPFFIRWFGAGWGNYWIIDLGKDYEYAVVSEPSKTYLWILSRTKPMSKTLYDDIVQRLQAKGFAVEKLVVSNNALSN